MTMSKDLYLAILSMDAHNRGYNVGLPVSGDQIGLAEIDTDSEEVFRNTSGAPGTPSPAEAASFYAIAYQMTGACSTGIADGRTIISYRGTDMSPP